MFVITWSNVSLYFECFVSNNSTARNVFGRKSFKTALPKHHYSFGTLLIYIQLTAKTSLKSSSLIELFLHLMSSTVIKATPTFFVKWIFSTANQMNI